MTHVDEETLQRALHGELDTETESRVGDHLAECPTCARRWEDAAEEEGRVFSLLEAIDHEPPHIGAASILDARSSADRWRPLIAAGVAFLVVAAGLAWAIPGSPVRDWVRSILSGDRPTLVSREAPAGSDPVSGISVEPGDSLEVVFAASQRAGTIHVSLVPSGEVRLEIVGAPPGIAVEPNRLGIANDGSSASYRVDIPESAPLVRIRVGSRPVLVKRGADVRTPAASDAAGEYSIPLQ